MSSTARHTTMRSTDWLALVAVLWILSSVAFAHEGHAPQGPSPQPAPPTMASGMLDNTSTAWRTEPKVVNNSKKIRPKETGTTRDRVAAARC